MAVKIEPIKQRVGATVEVDRAALCDPSVTQAILNALDQRNVLVFPRLNLTDEEQLAFTGSLGARTTFSDGTLNSKSGTPGIYKVTLDPKINDKTEYVTTTFFWHMDGMWVDKVPPPKATLLTARRAAPKGGQTEFADTAVAYEMLSPAEKAEIENLHVLHTVYSGLAPALDTEEEHTRTRRASMQTERPLVKHKSGRKSLMVGHTADRVIGMTVPEGRALLERLMEWAAQPSFMYRHDWQEGDLVIWNNRSILHRVVPYATTSGRMMHRTAVLGLNDTLQ